MRIRQTIAVWPLLLFLPVAGAGEVSSERVMAAGVLECTPSPLGGATWTLELDDRMPLAVIDEEDRPADYTPAHVRIRLTPEGTVMMVGRVSGRYLTSSASGEVLAKGHCMPTTHS